ncbi:MAG: NOB1 family endonuclease [Candidatus Nitrosocaldus sp.]
MSIDIKNKVAVLDATAFYAGIPLSSSSSSSSSPSSIQYYTTTAVINEVKHIKQSIDAIDLLVKTGRLRVVDPTQEYIEEVRAYAKDVGEYDLSDADISIIALALMMLQRSCECGVTIVTDDYSIANVAMVIGLSISYTISKGIRYSGKWVRYCRVCRITYSDASKVCRICGNELRSRLVSRLK